MFNDGKIRSGRRGDIHLIGELYFWTGKPNEGSNMSIADMLRAHTELKTAVAGVGAIRYPANGRTS